MDLKYLLKIFIIFFLILSLIIFINYFVTNFTSLQKQININKKLIKNITIEGLKNPLTINSNKAFCDINKGYDLETACNKLTHTNCGLTSCCIRVKNKCKARDGNGILFGE